MSANNIAIWKQKSEIDYIPLFMPLWLSLNAWLKYRISKKTDRDLIEWLKEGGNNLSDRFSEFMLGNDAESIAFRSHFSELYRALENTNIQFRQLPKKIEDNIIIILKDNKNKNKKNNIRKVTFKNTVLDWHSGKPTFDSIIKTQGKRIKILSDPNFYVDENIENVFKAYIENLYQVRCTLFHGDLLPNSDNERVIRALYLTLQMIMARV